MSYKNFQFARIAIAAFISILVSIAVTIENPYLALSAVIVGMISLLLMKKKVNAVMVDEMIENIAGKAARAAYGITVSILALASLIMTFSNLSARDSYYYNLGVILSYIVLFNMAVYSFVYYFYKEKYGSSNEE